MTTPLQCPEAVHPRLAAALLLLLLLPSTIFFLRKLAPLVVIFVVFSVAAMAEPLPSSSSFSLSAVNGLGWKLVARWINSRRRRLEAKSLDGRS